MLAFLALDPIAAAFAADSVDCGVVSEVDFAEASAEDTAAARLPVGTFLVKTCMLTTQALIKQVQV